jgi:SH3-like domain-containing protein
MPSQIKASLTVEQLTSHVHGQVTSGARVAAGAPYYKVQTTTNTTSPRVGDSLTEAEVKAEIVAGVKVTIK